MILSAITSVEGIPPESRPHTVIKNSPALPSCIITSPSKAVTTELPESSSSGVGNVVQVPPPLPQQPRLRVRPLEEMLDRKLLDQQMRDSSTAEKGMLMHPMGYHRNFCRFFSQCMLAVL